jgi:predicted Na+-dependent transporter
MRKLVCLLLLAFAGCTASTPHGKCIGLNQKESAALEYEYSAKNIILGVVFAELIIPPVIVVLDELKCPTGPKVTSQEGPSK